MTETVPTIPTIDGRFIKADETLRQALEQLEALRSAVTNAYQHGALGKDATKLVLVPNVTRQLSIAITEAEGALLRLWDARGRYNVVKGCS